MIRRLFNTRPSLLPRDAGGEAWLAGLIAVLCFLGAGHDHESELTIVDPVNAKRHRVGEVVNR